MATWLCTPTTFQPPGGPVTKSTTPVEKAWMSAAASDDIILADGDYRRWTLKNAPRPKGSVVAIRAENRHAAVVLRDEMVGSTDAIILKAGLDGLILDGLKIEVDDRAGIKTEPGGASKVTLLNCWITGRGNGPTDPLWKDNSKWGQHHYDRKGWAEIGTICEKVYDEHGDGYDHSIQGNQSFDGCVTRWCGRTNRQWVARQNEGSVAKGDVTVTNEYVEDVCLGQGGGGAAYSCHGGCPTSNFTFRNVTVRLGCNTSLALPFNRNITGSFMFRSAPESAPGAGDAAWPGNTKSLTLENVDCEVGTAYPGVGSARRANGDFAAIETMRLLGNVRWVQGPGADATAFKVSGSVVDFKWSAASVQWAGEFNYKGRRYKGWDAFAASPDGIATRL